MCLKPSRSISNTANSLPVWRARVIAMFVAPASAVRLKQLRQHVRSGQPLKGGN